MGRWVCPSYGASLGILPKSVRFTRAPVGRGMCGVTCSRSIRERGETPGQLRLDARTRRIELGEEERAVFDAVWAIAVHPAPEPAMRANAKRRNARRAETRQEGGDRRGARAQRERCPCF